MTKKSIKKKGDEDGMSIQEVIALQEHLKKEADIDKPDAELSPAEQVIKGLYQTLDNAVEKAVGKGVKKELDEKRKTMERLSKFQTSINKLTELGRDIEKNLVLQSAYLMNHFQKDENNRYFVVTRKLEKIALSESTPADQRIEAAQKILEIVKAYEEKMIGEMTGKQEIVEALLTAFEKALKATDFSALDDASEGQSQTKVMNEKYKKWMKLIKDLLKNRNKAITATQDDLDIDKVLAKFVIDNEGDITQKMSSFEIKSKGERLVRLANESNEMEKKIEEKKSTISVALFGALEEYMNLGVAGDSEAKQTSHNPLEEKAWFRFLKVVYIGLWIIGLGFVSLISLAFENFATLIIGVLIVWGLMTIIRKAFFYITLGNKE